VYSPWSSNIAACIESNRVRLMRRHVRDSHESPNSDPIRYAPTSAYERLRAPTSAYKRRCVCPWERAVTWVISRQQRERARARARDCMRGGGGVGGHGQKPSKQTRTWD
jgi:hypothetical protein